MLFFGKKKAETNNYGRDLKDKTGKKSIPTHHPNGSATHYQRLKPLAILCHPSLCSGLIIVLVLSTLLLTTSTLS